MKKLVITSILALLLTGGSTMRAQDRPDEYLGLPGDNLNLYAVMNLFQESETLEAFERKLNDENSRINNLDLNGDNMIDYITVSDYVDGNVHTIVMRTALSRNESQDLAVFTVEKFRNGEVQIQLIGDEALYGRNYIIEPNYAGTPNPGYRGNGSNATVVTTNYYEVAAWPVIRFMFQPAYMVWRSSWYWGYYPVYWNPWRPWYWHYYYGYHSHWYPHYYEHYRHWDHPRYAHYNDHYYNHIRTHSPMVSNRIKGGHYRTTYSHPEQRREGEALYARTSATRNTRSQAGTSTGTGDRRTAAQLAQNSRTATNGTGTTRRSSDGTSYRTGTGSSTGQNTATARRTTTTATERSSVTRPAESRATTTRSTTSGAVGRNAAGTSATQRVATTPRTNNPAVKRTTTRPSVTQRTAPARNSSPAMSQRTSSKPATAVQRTAPARSSGSSSTATRAVSRSSSHVSKSASPANKSSNTRVSGAGNSRRN